MVYLAAQQQNKLIQFPVCANIGVLFTLDILSQACEKHIQTRFSLWQCRFWSITQAIPSVASKRGHETKKTCCNRVLDMTCFVAKHLKFDSC